MKSDQPRDSGSRGAGGDDDLGDFLLRQADHSFAPPPAAASSVWRGVEGAMVAGSLAPAPLAPASPEPSSVIASLAPQKMALTLFWKVGLGVGVFGLLGTAGIFAGSRLLPPASTPTSVALAPTAVAEPSAAPSSFVVSSAAEAKTLIASAPSPSLVPSPGPHPQVGLSSSPQLPSHQDALPLPPSDAEKLLEAHRAIRSGDTARALALLGAVSPNGSMAEERDILTIEALAPSNKVKAQRLATQFLQQRPHSAYRGRAEAVLAR